jgi:hypothetical protein
VKPPTPPRRLKSPASAPGQGRTAEPAVPDVASSAPKGAARQGVLSALRPDQHQSDGRRPVAWLHVVAPPDWRAIPRGESHCECGRHVQAVGRAEVLALVHAHNDHRTTCPLRTTACERRQAA